MGFNWRAINSYEDSEVALYRLLGEMLRRRADLADLDGIRDFLLKAQLQSDGWLSLGEALHRTTSGSPVGFDIWLAWLQTFEDVDVDQERLGAKWVGFGEDLSDAVEDFDPRVDVLPQASVAAAPEPDALVPADVGTEADDDYDEDATDMMAPAGLDRPASSPRTNTGVLAESPTQLLRLVPQGPFVVRLFEREYYGVDEYTVLTLIKRGLFLGAEVQFGDQWLPSWKHPAFVGISGRLAAEAARILTRDFDDEPATQPND